MICSAMQLQAMRVSGLISALPVVDVAAYYVGVSKQLTPFFGSDFGSWISKEEEERGEAGRMEGKKRIFSWWTDQSKDGNVFGMLAYFN